jgi:dTDP-glucose pyrophosphorylase
MIRKAVVFAAGAGTRMQRSAAVALTSAQQEAAEEGHKALMPVGRPFLDHVLWAYAEAGITALCLVVRPDASALRARYAGRQIGALRVHFAEQASARGTADALWSAREFIGDDHVLTGNGDNLYPIDAIRALAQADRPGLAGFSVTALVERGNVAAARLAGFALLETDAAGDLTAIHEKPSAAVLAAAGPAARFSMNLLALPPVIVEACTRIAPSARGEYELPDAVRWTMHEAGIRYRVHPSDAAVLDLSQREDVPAVTERLRDVQLPW